MKKSIIIALAVALPFTVNAADEREYHDWHHHGKRLEHLAQELGLSTDQKLQLETIFKEDREKLKAFHEENRNKIKAILTSEQQAKFEALQHKRAEKWGKKVNSNQVN